jgi:hypothetical protein
MMTTTCWIGVVGVGEADTAVDVDDGLDVGGGELVAVIVGVPVGVGVRVGRGVFVDVCVRKGTCVGVRVAVVVAAGSKSFTVMPGPGDAGLSLPSTASLTMVADPAAAGVQFGPSTPISTRPSSTTIAVTRTSAKRAACLNMNIPPGLW